MRSIHTLAAAALLMTVGAAGFVSPAQAQSEGNRNGATGGSVISVTYPGGAFRRQPDGAWNEYDDSGRVIFRFRETGRDDWSVYLAEIGTDKQVQIDLYRMMIGVSQGGAPMGDLYTITSAQAPRAVPLPASTVDAFRITRVDFRDGYFQSTGGDGRWTEFRRDGSVAYRFVLRGTNSEAITLFDASRGTAVQFNLPRRMILISFNGAPFEDLYPITATTPPMAGAGTTPARLPPPSEIQPVSVPPIVFVTSSFKIEAGPITSQVQANAKCPALAARVRGTWTQGWERRDGVNSVCEIAFPQ